MTYAILSVAEQMGSGLLGGTFTGAAISLANVFLLHQEGRPYIFGPGLQ